jgi:hypothetical protein
MAKECQRRGHFCVDLATLEVFWLYSIQVQPTGLILYKNEPQVQTRTMTVNGNTCMKYIRMELTFHVSQIPINIDLNFERLLRVLLQHFDTNTHTHLIYRKEEAWSRHDTLEVKLQAQRHSTCVPLCISKARIPSVGKHLDTAPWIIQTELYYILFCR